MWTKLALDRYLLEGLPPAAEDRLRAHLARCRGCRARYDRRVLVLRALSGAPGQATPAEEERLAGLVLRRAGLTEASVPRPNLAWRGRLALAAAGLLLLVAGLVWLGPGSAPGPERLLEGLAEVPLARGGQLRLFPGARARLIAEQRVELEAGAIWCQLEPGGGEFLVRTALAEVRVLGTSFVVEQRADRSSEVRVMSGQVEVTARQGGQRVRLRADQKTAVLPDRSSAAVERYRPEADRQAWERVRARIRRALERAERDLGGWLRDLGRRLER
jgi:hypothetical protein